MFVMIVIKIGGTSFKVHYQEATLCTIDLLIFFFVLKKNHRYISVEFASFFKIEFDGIKLRKAASDKPKTFKWKSFSCPLGPAIGSCQGVTLTSYPQMLICSVFVPDFYNLLL